METSLKLTSHAAAAAAIFAVHRLQQQVLQDYYSPDVSFSLNGDFLKLAGRDEVQQLLRGSQILASYKPEVLDISSNADK